MQVAFCWNTQCSIMAPLRAASAPVRAFLTADAGPATAPANHLSGAAVVLTTLSPVCANATNTLALLGGVGTYGWGAANRLLSIPEPGVASVDVDVKIADIGTCDDDWYVRACCRLQAFLLVVWQSSAVPRHGHGCTISPASTL